DIGITAINSLLTETMSCALRANFIVSKRSYGQTLLLTGNLYCLYTKGLPQRLPDQTPISRLGS
ncbi:hypothetical protein J8A87_29310, partial [Vibrio parahaemolyticus]|nr:hypothetical protein [Vibrio parahaemolyticus]